MDCTRCLSKLSPQSLNLKHFGIDEPLDKLNCNDCRLCVYIRSTGDVWENIDTVLQNRLRKNGWQSVETGDRVTLYILSQIMYNEIEVQIIKGDEAYFDLPDDDDLIKILWHDGNAIGFYSVKRKESLIVDTMQTYEMTTLDTAYIRKSHRRRGLGLSILQDLIRTFPNEELGLSTPVSLSMYGVAHKFLTMNPVYKMKMWEISGVGSQGNRKLIYCSIKKIFKI